MRAGSLYLIFVGLLFLGAGSVFAWLMWRSFDRASDQREWTEAECTILVSRVAKRKIGQEVKTEYRFVVLYGYTFGDQARTSERYSLRGSPWSGEAGRAQALADKFPVGAEGTCYVDPADPSFAVIKRDSKAPGYSLWFPLIFVVGGLGIIGGGVRTWKRGAVSGGVAQD